MVFSRGAGAPAYRSDRGALRLESPPGRRVKLDEIGEFARLGWLVANPREVARARRSDGELCARFRNGRRFAMRGGHTDFHTFRRVFLSDEYKLGRRRFDTVLDLGGNIGCVALRVAPRARRVIVYEPDPNNLALLEHNLSGLAHVVVVPEAVAAESGRRQLHFAASGRWGARSTLFPEFQAQRANMADAAREVSVTTLDALFATHAIERCDLLKIDVEGAEYEIFGAASADTLARIERIVGEYHDVYPEDPRTRIDAFARSLEQAGFRVATAPSRRHANSGLFFAQRAS
jgi:FkbM family methyltransferase